MQEAGLSPGILPFIGQITDLRYISTVRC